MKSRSLLLGTWNFHYQKYQTRIYFGTIHVSFLQLKSISSHANTCRKLQKEIKKY